MLLSICLIFCQFQSGVAYKNLAYIKKACITLLLNSPGGWSGCASTTREWFDVRVSKSFTWSLIADNKILLIMHSVLQMKVYRASSVNTVSRVMTGGWNVHLKYIFFAQKQRSHLTDQLFRMDSLILNLHQQNCCLCQTVLLGHAPEVIWITFTLYRL